MHKNACNIGLNFLIIKLAVKCVSVIIIGLCSWNICWS